MSKKHTDYGKVCPKRSDTIAWSADENGIVTLDVENKGVFNRVFQLILKKPKVSHIHLDELGSFVWRSIDGVRNVEALCELVESELGDMAHPTEERLVKFLEILKEYKFITMNE